MQSRIRFFVPSSLRWVCFLVALALASTWVTRGVLVRAAQMKAADTPASSLYTMAAGAHTKFVVSLDRVSGAKLEGTSLERVSDALYRRPVTKVPPTVAELTPETSVVMGKREQIVPGAVVQLAGTVDRNHALQTTQVVILTNYVRVSEGAK
jgi:hypothetical protein